MLIGSTILQSKMGDEVALLLNTKAMFLLFFAETVNSINSKSWTSLFSKLRKKG